MQKHKVLQREQKKVGFFTIEDLTVEHGLEEGKQKVYSITRQPDWVNIVAETPDHKLVIVRQWRAGIDDWSLEVPGGKVDEGESPVEAGLRELKEETGYTVGSNSKISYLGEVLANPAIQDNKMHYVFVNNVVKTEDTEMDEFENVYTQIYERDKITEMLSSGAIKHAYSVLALYKTFKG